MIVVFHSLYFLVRYALRVYHRYKAQQIILREAEQRLLLEAEPPHQVKHDPEECFVFPIPVYRQRYSGVQDVLLDPKWRVQVKRVVDFGCAEFGFFQYLKHLIGITDVFEVDIDEMLLKDNMFRVRPLTADYLKERNDPLSVHILRGSIGDPDWRIKGIDAIIGIEIIEHLYPDILEALPYNIFGFAQPKVAIFTTPNADFNVLFPNFKGFRHDDHKFEWTREQFQDWANNIVTRFPNYSVTFYGIGKGPQGTESLGCCSQMAVFAKEYDITSSEVPELSAMTEVTDWRSFGICTNYSFSNAQMSLLSHDFLALQPSSSTPRQGNEFYILIDCIRYPYTKDERTPQEKLLHQASQQIFMHTSQHSRYYNDNTGFVEIPLYEVVRNFDGHFATEAEIKSILEAAHFKIAECTLYGSEERCLCVVYDVDMAGNSSKTASEYEPSLQANELDDDDEEEENWEANAPPPPLSTNSLDDDGVLPLNINSSNESDGEAEERMLQLPAAAKDEVATPSDPLVDSGYQKSLSNAEWSPQSPIDMQFEEQFAPKMDVNDIKDSIKGGHAGPLKLSPQMSPPAAGASVKVKSPTAGSSRRRKTSHGAAGGGRHSDSEESNSAREDVKSIADLLMYNSLNKLNIVDVPQVEQVVLPVERPQDLELPQFIVENGDLANNNRDGEGNNIPEVDVIQGLPIEHNGDDPNENIEVQNDRDQLQDIDEDEENRNVEIQPLANHDDGIVADAPPAFQVEPHPPVIMLPQIPVVEIIDVHHGAPVEFLEEDEEAVNQSSREAVFDPNSETDMLEDGFLTDDTLEYDADAAEDQGGHAAGGAGPLCEETVPVNNLFPLWLLQLLRCAEGVVLEVDVGDEEDTVAAEDEAHFYCQGDGLGVHPSVIEVDTDSASNSTDSTDEAVAEHTISENDAGSLPADSLAAVTMPSTSHNTGSSATLSIFGRALDLPMLVLDQTSSTMSQDSGGEEFYDPIGTPTLPQFDSTHDTDSSNHASK